LKRIAELVGLERVLETVDLPQLIELDTVPHLIEVFGEEKVLRVLFGRFPTDQLQELLRRREQDPPKGKGD